MIINDHIHFEILNSKLHDRIYFDCGNIYLNKYLQLLASQQQKRNLTSIYVATIKEQSIHKKPIFGYYSLCCSELEHDSLPETISRYLPSGYIIPSITIGRLARDLSKTQHGFGSLLLHNALLRILRLSEHIGIFAVEVEAKNASLVDYYKSFGFIELLKPKNNLMITRSTLEELVGMSTAKFNRQYQPEVET